MNRDVLISDEQQRWRVIIAMIEVEGGTFNMGNPEPHDEASMQEAPVHQVTLSSYKIG